MEEVRKIKANIRYYRERAGLTQKELGDKCAIAEPTIRRYELGKLNPKYETLRKIADALNVSVDEIACSETIGDKIRNARKRAGLSQSELAHRLDHNHTTISKWENGTLTPKLSDILKIAKECNVCLEELVPLMSKKEAEDHTTKKNEGVLDFHEAMKAHCIAADRNCEACCMRLYCYTPPCEKTDSMVKNVLSFLESQHIRTDCDSHSDRHTESDPMPCPCSMDMSTAIGYEPH